MKQLATKIRNFSVMLALAVPLAFAAPADAQDVLHFWSFNDGENSELNDGSNEPTSIPADIGTAVINHSLSFSSFGGNTTNIEDGFEAGADWAIAGTENIGESFEIEFSTEGFENIVFSSSATRTGAGYDNNSIEVSADGGSTFTSVAANVNFSDTPNPISYNLSSALEDVDDNSSVVLRVTFDVDAATGGGNNRFDNMKLEGNQVAGDTQVATPSISPESGSYFSDQEVTISVDGTDKTIYYTLDGEDPTDASTEYTAPFTVEDGNGAVVIRAIAYDNTDEKDPSSIASSTLDFPVNVSNIEELWTILEDDGLSDAPTFRITGESIVLFNASELGSTNRNQKYLQDGTAGIKIDDSNGNLTTTLNQGDGIENIVGTVSAFNRMLQFVPVAGQSPESASSTGNTIDSQTVTIAEFIDDDNFRTIDGNQYSVFQGQLITIEDLEFDATGNFDSSANFGELSVFDPTASLSDINDADNGFVFRVEYGGLDYNGEPIPEGPVDTNVLVDQRNQNIRVFARSSADFIFDDVFANLQIIHNSPDPAVSSVDIFVNGEEFLTGVDFRTATAFTSVTANVDLDIQIAPADAGIQNAVGPITVNLEEDGNYIAVASGVLDPSAFTGAAEFSLELLTNARTSAESGDDVDVVIHHGSPDAPGVDIYLTQTGDSPAISNLEYPSFTDYVSLNPVNEVVGIAGAGGEVLFEFSAPFQSLNAAGASVTVLASGFFDDDNSFGLLAVLADGTAILLSEPFDGTIGWANLQWPETLDLSSNEEGMVYAEVYAEGVTEGDEASELISAWIGVFNEDTDPADWPESAWIEAEFNESKGNNDEYQAAISRTEPGTYYYASRFQLADNDPVYGGFQGGFWDGEDNVSGVMTVTPVEVENLAELRAGETDGTIYQLNNEVVLTFNSNFRGRKVVSDATAGIVFDVNPFGDFAGVIETEYNRYDGITGITGSLAVFNGLLQFQPITDPGEASSSDNTVYPIKKSIADLDFEEDVSSITGQLVILQNVTIEQSGTWENQQTYTINDADGNSLNLRTDRLDPGGDEAIYYQGEAPFIGSPIPEGPVNIVGYMTQFNSIQIVPRLASDITPADAIAEFDLESPENGSTLVVEGEGTDTITIAWTEAESDDEVTYSWIAASPLTTYAIPSLELPSANTNITLSNQAVDGLLAQFGVEVGGSIPLQWTVVARTENGIQYAEQVWTVTLERGMVTNLDEAVSDLPQSFELNQNYPNPFNPTTQIEYALPQASDVQISVYNITGQRVALLLNNERQSAGYHTVSFDASNLASGMYLYRIQAGNFVQTRKMTLIK